MNFIILSIIFGIIAGLLTIPFIKNVPIFRESYIIFGSVYFLIVFGCLALKIRRVSFIKQNLLKFLLELLFIGLFTYLYCILIYYFRGLSIKKDHVYFVMGSLLFIIVHTLIEVAGIYDR